MEQAEVYKIISENMDKIFAFSLARISNRERAEDLAGDIILELMKSYQNIRNDKAFYAFMWAVANNVYKKYVRSDKKSNYDLFDNDYIFVDFNTPESSVVEIENTMLLRRELSLLSGRYRDVVVRFYMKNKSCEEIADELGISSELVRYTLHWARKMLREGIEMNRTYGEKSYAPDNFRIEGHFMQCSHDWWVLFKKRKMPGNILLAAYEKAVTASELSVELGVSAVYLEDEIRILVEDGLLKETAGKYITNIVISTDEYEREWQALVRDMADKTADEIYKLTNELVKDIPDIEICNMPLRRELLVDIAVYEVLRLVMYKRGMELWEHMGTDAVLEHGDIGLLFGHDTIRSNNYYGPICYYLFNREKTSYTHFVERNIEGEKFKIKKIQYNMDLIGEIMNGENVDNEDSKLLELIENGYVVAENGEPKMTFPVLRECELERLHQHIEPIVNFVYEYVGRVQRVAMSVIKKYVPKHLKKRSVYVAETESYTSGTGMVRDIMIDKGYISDYPAYIIGVIESDIYKRSISQLEMFD